MLGEYLFYVKCSDEKVLDVKKIMENMDFYNISEIPGNGLRLVGAFDLRKQSSYNNENAIDDVVYTSNHLVDNILEIDGRVGLSVVPADSDEKPKIPVYGQIITKRYEPCGCHSTNPGTKPGGRNFS